MIFKWESQKERLSRFMKIPPKKKMEWLNQMHEFLGKALTKRQKDVYRILRERR